MKLSVEIQNNQIAQKVIWFLEHLSSEGVKIIETSEDLPETETKLTDDYIQEHWRELMATGLANYDENYYKSDQYKEDRGNYLAEKYK